jgi:hypothetical protein
MTRITIEPALLGKLSAIREGAELCDSLGRSLGYFFPADESRRPGAWPDDLERPPLDSEFEKSRRVRTGKPLEEILRRLDSQ